ncbi:Oidioi.mRNA.OKI2018_I69.chr1.g3408.t1.cds [Oikopleura dioica]|uniref:Oidioi.mRNA.OKI2018_I69.chr1.g3408.t1.cds n=1 Tax=Oikopleura dioica TaxID=34765 RepID=A0ABN7T370_OIKDI|nr:Oidioi.mRNA.OKI2018_I69.chr1.g3408.t1.cds [Oikopleura dioica]
MDGLAIGVLVTFGSLALLFMCYFCGVCDNTGSIIDKPACHINCDPGEEEFEIVYENNAYVPNESVVSEEVAKVKNETVIDLPPTYDDVINETDRGT